jgi:hypothetical protein
LIFDGKSKNSLRRGHKIALHRRGSSQRAVKDGSKESITAFAWAVLSHLFGVRSWQERATFGRRKNRLRREKVKWVDVERLFHQVHIL